MNIWYPCMFISYQPVWSGILKCCLFMFILDIPQSPTWHELCIECNWVCHRTKVLFRLVDFLFLYFMAMFWAFVCSEVISFPSSHSWMKVDKTWKTKSFLGSFQINCGHETKLLPSSLTLNIFGQGIYLCCYWYHSCFGCKTRRTMHTH